MQLTQKHCLPCEGGKVPVLTDEEAEKLHAGVPEWMLLDSGVLDRNFVCRDFAEAVRFLNEVARIAEEESHHPDIQIHAWKNIRFTLWTHAIGGLSENDFILAAKIDDAASRLGVGEKK